MLCATTQYLATRYSTIQGLTFYGGVEIAYNGQHTGPQVIRNQITDLLKSRRPALLNNAVRDLHNFRGMIDNGKYQFKLTFTVARFVDSKGPTGRRIQTRTFALYVADDSFERMMKHCALTNREKIIAEMMESFEGFLTPEEIEIAYGVYETEIIGYPKRRPTTPKKR